MLSEEEIRKKFDNVEFEKNDVAAIVIAALITIVPIVLLLMGLFYGLIWFFFLR